MCAGEELENHARSDDRRDTEFHQSSTVRGHHHTQPVERIRAVGRDDAVQGHLAHDEEDEEGNLFAQCQATLCVYVYKAGKAYSRPC
jgi:hypothetical protein